MWFSLACKMVSVLQTKGQGPPLYLGVFLYNFAIKVTYLEGGKFRSSMNILYFGSHWKPYAALNTPKTCIVVTTYERARYIYL